MEIIHALVSPNGPDMERSAESMNSSASVIGKRGASTLDLKLICRVLSNKADLLLV